MSRFDLLSTLVNSPVLRKVPLLFQVFQKLLNWLLRESTVDSNLDQIQMESRGLAAFHLEKWVPAYLYSIRGLERSELGGSQGCPGRFGDQFLWQVYIPSKASCHSGRPVTKIGAKGALGSHELHPIHSAPSLGQSILTITFLRPIRMGTYYIRPCKKGPEALTSPIKTTLFIYNLGH